MFNPQMTSSQMELLPLVCLCLLSWSGTTSADQHETVVVKQDDDAILPCSIKGSNLETAVFDWKKDGQTEVFMYDAGSHYNNGRTGQNEKFKGRVSHFQDELKHGNASIKITNVKMTDSGDYTCEFPNQYPPPTFHIKLVVGAAPKPSVTTLHQTETSALLQCEAHGIPDLEVHWQDSDGNKLPAEEPQVTERGGLKYITLKTTVTKTDRFYCVATQKNINHTISAEIFVYIHDYTGLTVAGVGVVIAFVVVGVGVGVLFVLVKKGSIKLNFNKDEKKPEDIPLNKPNSEKKPEEIPKTQCDKETQTEEIPLNQPNSENQPPPV